MDHSPTCQSVTHNNHYETTEAISTACYLIICDLKLNYWYTYINDMMFQYFYLIITKFIDYLKKLISHMSWSPRELATYN